MKIQLHTEHAKVEERLNNILPNQIHDRHRLTTETTSSCFKLPASVQCQT